MCVKGQGATLSRTPAIFDPLDDAALRSVIHQMLI